MREHIGFILQSRWMEQRDCGPTWSHWESSGIALSKGHVTLTRSRANPNICESNAVCEENDIYWSKSSTPGLYDSLDDSLND